MLILYLAPKPAFPVSHKTNKPSFLNTFSLITDSISSMQLDVKKGKKRKVRCDSCSAGCTSAGRVVIEFYKFHDQYILSGILIRIGLQCQQEY